MKKTPLILRFAGMMLAGFFAAVVFLSEHADLLFRSLQREEDSASRTVSYKTKNGFFTVGGTGLSLSALSSIRKLFGRNTGEEIILTEPET
ncbi:MAG: hypothetical protein IJD13_06780 [Oscillospiraceae bacterium]|nr:hypothetical protein [Oscillospiraceae bacterium]